METRIIRVREHLCGYVGVPKEHPWYGKGYLDRVPVPKALQERQVATNRICLFSLFTEAFQEPDGLMPITLAIDVHGGVTFAGTFDDSELWWFGFDCNHAQDQDNPKDEEYVRREIEELKRQLEEVATWQTE